MGTTATATPATPNAPATSPAASDAPGGDDQDLFTSAAPDVGGDPDSAPATDPPPEEPPTEPTPEGEDTEPTEEVTPSDPVPPATPAPEFDITIPLPAQEGKRSGTLALAFPTQEARDTIQFHVKRSQDYDAVAADAEAGITARATLAHVESAPDQAMYVLEQIKPEAAKAYVENWMQRNPIAAAVAVRDLLGYSVEEAGNEARLTDRAELAKLKAAEALRVSQSAYGQTLAQQRQQQVGSAAIRALAATAHIDLQSPEGDYVAKQLATAFAQHLTTTPTATRADLAALPAVRDILNVYQRLVAPAPSPVKPSKAVTTPAADPVARMAAQRALADKMGKLAPGQTRIPALRAEKFKRGTTLDDLP